VRMAPDLRDARVFVAVIGDAEAGAEKLRWLGRHSGEIRRELGRRVTMKYLPKFNYQLDDSAERGARMLELLDRDGPPVAPP